MRVDFLGTKNGQRIVVEYDSFYYHKDKFQIDYDKAIALLNSGIAVIRIRHKGLPSLCIKHPNYKEIIDENLNSANTYERVAKRVKILISTY